MQFAEIKDTLTGMRIDQLAEISSTIRDLISGERAKQRIADMKAFQFVIGS